MKRFGTIVLFSVCLSVPVLLLNGCYLTPEGFYGFNTLILRNESDLFIESLYIVEAGAPSRGIDYLNDEGGLEAGRSFSVEQLKNGAYTLEVDYREPNADAPAGQPQYTVKTDQLANVDIRWGEVFTWFWYGPAPVESTPPPSE